MWGAGCRPAHRPARASKHKGAASEEPALLPLPGESVGWGAAAAGFLPLVLTSHLADPASSFSLDASATSYLHLSSAPKADPAPGLAPTALFSLHLGQPDGGGNTVSSSVSPQAPWTLLSDSHVRFCSWARECLVLLP